MFRLIFWLYWAWSWRRKAHPTLFPFVGPFSFSPGECEVALVYQMITTQPHNAVSLKIYRRLVKDNWRMYRQNISLWQGSCNNKKFFSKTVSPRSCLPGSSECGSRGVIAMETSDIYADRKEAHTGHRLKREQHRRDWIVVIDRSIALAEVKKKYLVHFFFFLSCTFFPPRLHVRSSFFLVSKGGGKKLVATNGNTAVER